jgi:hypothetical protein
MYLIYCVYFASSTVSINVVKPVVKSFPSPGSSFTSMLIGNLARNSSAFARLAASSLPQLCSYHASGAATIARYVPGLACSDVTTQPSQPSSNFRGFAVGVSMLAP